MASSAVPEGMDLFFPLSLFYFLSMSTGTSRDCNQSVFTKRFEVDVYWLIGKIASSHLQRLPQGQKGVQNAEVVRRHWTGKARRERTLAFDPNPEEQALCANLCGIGHGRQAPRAWTQAPSASFALRLAAKNGEREEALLGSVEQPGKWPARLFQK